MFPTLKVRALHFAGMPLVIAHESFMARCLASALFRGPRSAEGCSRGPSGKTRRVANPIRTYFHVDAPSRTDSLRSADRMMFRYQNDVVPVIRSRYAAVFLLLPIQGSDVKPVTQGRRAREAQGHEHGAGRTRVGALEARRDRAGRGHDESGKPLGPARST